MAFLSRFHIVDVDLDIAGGLTETLLRSLLTATLPDSDPAVAAATWNELITLAVTDAGRAMSYTREKLPRHLLEHHDRLTGYSAGVARLLEDTRVVEMDSNDHRRQDDNRSSRATRTAL